jgi:hypothetical protein
MGKSDVLLATVFGLGILIGWCVRPMGQPEGPSAAGPVGDSVRPDVLRLMNSVTYDDLWQYEGIRDGLRNTGYRLPNGQIREVTIYGDPGGIGMVVRMEDLVGRRAEMDLSWDEQKALRAIWYARREKEKKVFTTGRG